MSTYSKPHRTFEQQVDLLKSRGLDVPDAAAAATVLRYIGYYRLSAYWYPFRQQLPPLPITPTVGRVTQRGDTFEPGSRFQDALDLYAFDKRLRLLLLDAIERIEIAFRVDVAYHLGSKDTFAQMRPDLLHGNFTKKVNPKTGRTRYQAWLEKHDQLVLRSKEDFVQHYQDKYGLPLPIWVSVELRDFGLLSTFYQGMQVPDKAHIAQTYGLADWQVMESWLRTLNFVRNVAAHHSRLWNKNLVDQPKLPATGDVPAFGPLIGQTGVTSRLYVVLCIALHLMQRINPTSSWPQRLRQELATFPRIQGLSLADMGFPTDWQSHSFWDTSRGSA